MEFGALVISLDFELYWGVRDKRSLAQYGRNILGGRKAIPKMLDLFAERAVGATWATVGLVFCGSKDELMAARPQLLPRYADPRLSPYDFSSIGKDESADPYSFGQSLVLKIKQYERQEIGTHTLSHFYRLEEGGTGEAFAADLDGAKALVARNGVTLKSIVFPRNQVCTDALRIARERGLIAFRGNPRVWFNRACPDGRADLAETSGAARRHVLARGRPTRREARRGRGHDRCAGEPLLATGSRRLARALPVGAGQMTAAAKTNTLFHLWWHPHNFGADPEANLLFLRQILDRYAILRDRFGMRSLNTSEVAERVLQ